MPYFGIFGLEFEKNIAIFQITTLEFVILLNFTKKEQWLNLGPNMLSLGIFRLEFQNPIVIFEMSTLEFA